MNAKYSLIVLVKVSHILRCSAAIWIHISHGYKIISTQMGRSMWLHLCAWIRWNVTLLNRFGMPILSIWDSTQYVCQIPHSQQIFKALAVTIYLIHRSRALVCFFSSLMQCKNWRQIFSISSKKNMWYKMCWWKCLQHTQIRSVEHQIEYDVFNETLWQSQWFRFISMHDNDNKRKIPSDWNLGSYLY